MEQTVNSFQKGLLMDTHPMIQGNEVLSDALNATYITTQGNEIILQNDMGNRKIEEAFLPPGYVPVGVKEYGGIIYVASYNPLTNRGLLGSFPSPERTSLYNYDGQEINFGFDTFMEKGFCFLKELSRVYVIYKDILHTGDKFTLFSINELWSNPDYQANITNFCNTIETKDYKKVYSPKNKQYTLSVGILDLNNNFIDITKDLNRYLVDVDTGDVTSLRKTGNKLFDFNYGYFLAEKTEGGLEDIVESYRKIVGEASKGTLYKLKINSPLCIKVLHNYPSKFSYKIDGIPGEGNTTILELTITAILEYNCPDNGMEKEGDFDDNYYNYFISSVEYCKFFDFQIVKNGEYILMWPLSWEAIEESGFLAQIADKLNKLNLDNITKAKVKEILNEIIAFYPEDSTYTAYLEQLENSNDPLTPEEIKGSVSYSISEAYVRIVYNVDQSLLPKISHYINDKGEVVYKAEISRKYTKVVNYLEQTDITYNRINSNGEHIVDYFIGIPYSLIEQTNTCENPYIRSLSTFGEINIDRLNRIEIYVLKWRFKTEYDLDLKKYITTVDYRVAFNLLDDTYYPYTITVLDINGNTVYTLDSKENELIGSFLLQNDNIGEAYKVRISVYNNSREDYWILCTYLFNKLYERNEGYLNFVEPSTAEEKTTIDTLLTIPACINFTTHYINTPINLIKKKGTIVPIVEGTIANITDEKITKTIKETYTSNLFMTLNVGLSIDNLGNYRELLGLEENDLALIRDFYPSYLLDTNNNIKNIPESAIKSYHIDFIPEHPYVTTCIKDGRSFSPLGILENGDLKCEVSVTSDRRVKLLKLSVMFTYKYTFDYYYLRKHSLLELGYVPYLEESNDSRGTRGTENDAGSGLEEDYILKETNEEGSPFYGIVKATKYITNSSVTYKVKDINEYSLKESNAYDYTLEVTLKDNGNLKLSNVNVEKDIKIDNFLNIFKYKVYSEEEGSINKTISLVNNNFDSWRTVLFTPPIRDRFKISDYYDEIKTLYSLLNIEVNSSTNTATVDTDPLGDIDDLPIRNRDGLVVTPDQNDGSSIIIDGDLPNKRT